MLSEKDDIASGENGIAMLSDYILQEEDIILHHEDYILPLEDNISPVKPGIPRPSIYTLHPENVELKNKPWILMRTQNCMHIVIRTGFHTTKNANEHTIPIASQSRKATNKACFFNFT